jgi:anaerobic selenocysteine-containing dehydrogenase
MALDRRGFLMFVAGGAVGTACTPLPWKMIDDISIWTQNWPWIPKIPKGSLQSKPSISRLGSTEYGILINTVGDHPVTAQGNPEHILSQGGIDPLAASSVQLLYSPSRIQHPLKKNAQGTFEPISWKEATQLLKQHLEEVRGQKNSLACISGDETSSAHEVLSAFLQKMGSEQYFFQPSDAGTQLRVWQDFMGGTGQIGYDLEQSDLVLVCGADLLESWGTVIRNQKIFGKQQTQFVYVGPYQNNTAAVTNEWIPLKEDDFGHFLMALSFHVLKQRHPFMYGPVGGLQAYKQWVMKRYHPDRVAKAIGLSQKTISELAGKLLRARRPLIITGSSAGSGMNSFPFFAGLSLNMILNRINKKGGIQCIPQPPKILESATQLHDIQKRDLCGFLHDIDQGTQDIPNILFVYEANPAYCLPQPKTTQNTLKKIPFKVSFSQFMDETAALSDLILPAPYFLERRDDSFTPFGSGQANYSLAQPVTKKMTNSKITPDFIIHLAKQMGIELGIDSYTALLKTKSSLLGARWSDLKQGKAWHNELVSFQFNLSLWNSKIEQAAKETPSAENSFPLQVCAGNSFKTGSNEVAIPPFCLKTLLENELQDDLLYVSLNSQTAKQYNLRSDEVIQLISPSGKCRAKVKIEESLMPDVVFVPQGFGHTAWDEFSREKGENVMKLLTIRREKGSQITTWSHSKVKIAKI